MVSRSTPKLSALLLADDLQLLDEKMLVFTPICASVFLNHLAIVSLVSYNGKQKVCMSNVVLCPTF